MSIVAGPVRDHSVEIALQVLDELLSGYPRRDFAVRLWNGEVWGSSDHPRFTLVLRHPGALRRMLLGADQVKLGEAYVYDDFDVEGDIEAAFEFGDYLVAHELELTEKLRLAGLLLKLPHHDHHRRDGHHAPELPGRLHSRDRDRRAVTYHYNLSNDFYSLWLDQRMVYSCAWFERGDEDIDTAQARKLDYICRKLRLRPGERLLDVGCGWGGLILYAARNFGVHALGVTLSEPQAELAKQRIHEAGLGDRCQAEVRDYRDLDPSSTWDKIVSVGMFEHVGELRLPEYFQHVWKLLRAGGVFLNHGIAASATFRRKGPSFIDKYVFPDGGLVPLGTTIRIAEACGFEVRDVESLREHYARTLRQWVRRLESRYEDAKRLTNETIYRIWRIYMAGSAHAFAKGRVNVYQVLFSKPQNGETGLPLTRADWYV
ncbi:MAG TPA: cyclopropane-fatty-acyl-phospholipid synthase family protein [Candidatus Binatia bacterium]|nr:cyclopropane-fatty-acyl-phospholipid synthase family protein [Candidatus Binatia bacterium]